MIPFLKSMVTRQVTNVRPHIRNFKSLVTITPDSFYSKSPE
jgi:hypothetical protein